MSKKPWRDLAGMRFGKLVVQRRITPPTGEAKWECQCDCGNTYLARPSSLTDGQTGSCGCRLHAKVEFICDGCGTPFTTYASQRPRPLKFCTRQCGWKHQGKYGRTKMLGSTVDTEPGKPSPAPSQTDLVYLVSDTNGKRLQNGPT